MNIGIFTDTYFPQVSGVATSIKTLKNELESKGHHVYIFTTSDPLAKDEPNVLRFPSVPLLSFKERRIVISGLFSSCEYGRELSLDLIHTQTEFGMGLLGKRVAKKLDIPVIHTYHTMYEDYLHYIANGKLLRPVHVRAMTRRFTRGMAGIVCPSQRVVDKLVEYEIEGHLTTIPTGINIKQFLPKESASKRNIRSQYGMSTSDILLLSLSRISYEKNIQAIIKSMPEIVQEFENAKLMVVGNGPYLEDLQALVNTLDIADNVIFTGEIQNEFVDNFYREADLFVNASTSESQGLTYIEAMASGAKVVAPKGPYLEGLVDDPALGVLYQGEDALASTVIGYLKSDYLKMSVGNDVRERKLKEISSEQFGENMIHFYKEAIVRQEKLEYKV